MYPALAYGPFAHVPLALCFVQTYWSKEEMTPTKRAPGTWESGLIRAIKGGGGRGQEPECLWEK